jgi:multicomponent Na+:H+ antiporter subunit D
VVLRGGDAPPVEAAPAYSAPASAYLYSALTLTSSIAVAAAGLFGARLRGSIARGVGAGTRAAVAPLRAVHSGHIGDYVAWLVAGVALLGGAFAIALQ